MGKKTKGVNNRRSGGIDFIRAKKKVGKKIKTVSYTHLTLPTT